jgi:hypothetical protein
LPSAVIGFAYADPASAQLQHDRAFPALDNAAAGRFAKVVEVAPLAERQHPVAVSEGLLALLRAALGFGW